MKKPELELMPIDELWALHEEVSAALAARLAAEKRVLDERLNLVSKQARVQRKTLKRRPYPPVLPKYRNPDNPAETWSGRGVQPHWVAQQLRLGKRIEELKIDAPSRQVASVSSADGE